MAEHAHRVAAHRQQPLQDQAERHPLAAVLTRQTEERRRRQSRRAHSQRARAAARQPSGCQDARERAEINACPGVPAQRNRHRRPAQSQAVPVDRRADRQGHGSDPVGHAALPPDGVKRQGQRAFHGAACHRRDHRRTHRAEKLPWLDPGRKPTKLPGNNTSP